MCWHKLDGAFCVVFIYYLAYAHVYAHAYSACFTRIGWPDSSEGLHFLKKKYIIATLSNGNVRLLADMVSVFDCGFWCLVFCCLCYLMFILSRQAICNY